MSERETYLGDGLYVSFDGWMFVLRAPREHGDHWVGLVPGRGHTLENFLDYVKRTKEWQESDATEAEKVAARKRDAAEGFPDE